MKWKKACTDKTNSVLAWFPSSLEVFEYRILCLKIFSAGAKAINLS